MHGRGFKKRSVNCLSGSFLKVQPLVTHVMTDRVQSWKGGRRVLRSCPAFPPAHGEAEAWKVKGPAQVT